MREGIHDPLLDRKTAAKYLGLKNHNTLAVWDCTGRYDLQPIKVGGAVRYRQSSLDAFLDSRLFRKGR
jgi:predicted DNA-binding transcriptional regulator AlpA